MSNTLQQSIVGPFEDNNAHLQCSFKMNRVNLAEFLELEFQLSLASLKCLGILVLSSVSETIYSEILKIGNFLSANDRPVVGGRFT